MLIYLTVDGRQVYHGNILHITDLDGTLLNKNDRIPMFEISDESYAVENAVDELKAIAAGVIDSNENDGVAKWLEEHV